MKKESQPIEKIKFNSKNLEYETKCRRCGTLTQWFFSESSYTPMSIFREAMNNYIAEPRVFHCEKCKGNTIQDLTAYSD